MYDIEATRRTWLKRFPVQQIELSEMDKIAIPKGRVLSVEDFSESLNQHFFVYVKGDFEGFWHIYDGREDSHWDCAWERDFDELENDVLLKPNPALLGNPNIVGSDLKPDDPFSTRITPHITYGEFCLYRENRRFLYPHQCETAYKLALFGEKIRTEFGDNPLRLTSGHRPKAENQRVGGATRSEHLYRAPGIGAIDVQVVGVSPYDVQKYCDKNWSHSVGYGAKRGFVHLGIGRGRLRWPY